MYIKDAKELLLFFVCCFHGNAYFGLVGWICVWRMLQNLNVLCNVTLLHPPYLVWPCHIMKMDELLVELLVSPGAKYWVLLYIIDIPSAYSRCIIASGLSE